IDGPMRVGVINITDPTVRPRHADGVTAEGIPYYDLTDLLSAGSLNPGDSIAGQTLSFHNPGEVKFRFELVLLGVPNEAPAFTTAPVVETPANKPYAYDADAVDPENDSLLYRLLSGPSDLTLNETTGEINW